MSPWVHAKNSKEKFGGNIEDYLPIHELLDMTKTHYVGFQHRAILHNTFGIYICERIFGPVIKNSDHIEIETRYIVMEHIIEDLGFIPTVKEWVELIPYKPWMSNNSETKELTTTLDNVLKKFYE